jgi:hypothetical protein
MAFDDLLREVFGGVERRAEELRWRDSAEVVLATETEFAILEQRHLKYCEMLQREKKDLRPVFAEQRRWRLKCEIRGQLLRRGWTPPS